MKKHRFVLGYVTGLASFGIANQFSLWGAPAWAVLIVLLVLAYAGVEVWNRVDGSGEVKTE
jgi:hypothetical protein